jgi:type I restriction enzyme R subunit
LDKLPKGIRDNKEAMAETIENNLRKLIIDEQPVNPKYYEKMSELLDALIQERKAQALEYKKYLTKLVELAGKVKKPAETSAYPASLDSPAKRALYDNLDYDEELAIRIDTAVRYTKKDDWRGNRFKEREVMNAVREELGTYVGKAEAIFALVKNQREY